MLKPAHTRKKGPGRRHVQGDGVKSMAQKAAGHYGRFLRDWITGKNLAEMRYGYIAAQAR